MDGLTNTRWDFIGLSTDTKPTPATVGILGKIYIDTSTDNAYMCTKVESGTYTWKKITA